MYILSDKDFKRIYKSLQIRRYCKTSKTEINEGCKEVWLTSTDNGCYGFDIGTDLPSLINAVSEIPKNS